MFAYVQVWMTWLHVAPNTRRTDVTLLNGVAYWRLARIPQATKPFWKMLMSWPVMPAFASHNASSQLLSPRSYPMATTIWIVAKRSPKLCSPPATKHWATITFSWKVPCWNQICAHLDKAIQRRQQMPKLLWLPYRHCVALYHQRYLVSLYIIKSFKITHFHNFLTHSKVSLSCLAANLKKRPPSTWTPSTKFHWSNHGHLHSHMAVHCKPQYSVHGLERKTTSRLDKENLSSAPRWVKLFINFTF